MRYTQSRSVEGAPNSVNNIVAKRESRRVPPILRLRTAKQLTTTPPSCLGISLFPLPGPLYSLFNQPSYHHLCKHTYRIINIHVIGLVTMDASQQNVTRSGRRNAERRARKQSLRERSKTCEQKIDARNENHAPSKDEVYDINPEYDEPKRNTGQNDANEEDTPSFEGQRPPLATFNLLRILPKVEIHAHSTLFIRNPRASGPQTDICARIPGNDNNWAARVSCYDSLFDLYDWVRGNSSEESPEIWMYVSNIPHTFINIKDILTVSLDEPVSIVAFANPVNSLPSGWALVSLSPRPLLPGLREILGEDGAEWLV
ncbi:hypothetical protein FOYG_01909 [Fusarium oxysporum NRRL 32931]|uniref:Uncharacterized protein n=1 Tax=Fusarium oxysporum NRRL 32931 TaxID=660029 RepID=W9JDC4_FUSOX|nr:hypothetical protein FOYG_01909 [Fusarium oxysporum NRRL 32931]